MLNIKDACKSRDIRKVAQSTPLLVPSFSSVVSEDISEIRNKLYEYINKTSLVSAYDLHYTHIDINDLWHSDLVFIDSGNYETKKLDNSLSKKEWKCEYYIEILKQLQPMNKFVIVNYDEIEGIDVQIGRARELFNTFPEHASCFLCKPQPDTDGKVHVTPLIEKMDDIEQFDILGLTEKEIGNSLLERCSNIVKLREALSRRTEIPIHIFGCLDPLSIISYFLCGADIFDGTSWLKYTFVDNVAVYINNHALLKKRWTDNDDRARAHSSVHNLGELINLEARMNHYTQEYDLSLFQFQDTYLDQIKALTGAAGIYYGG